MYYVNRYDAGQRLAKRLRRFRGRDVVVLALPRGGVVLGAEVARALQAPLGLVMVRKISHPAAPEYAIGAIAEDDPPIYDDQEVIMVDEEWLDQAVIYTEETIKRRRKLYYGDDFVPPVITGKTAIIVDDGIATGLTMEAAVRFVRRQHPKQIVVAVPVAAQVGIDELNLIADQVVVLDDPANFLGAVGAHYHTFEQVNDEEVRQLLREVRDDIRQDASARATSVKPR